MLILCKLNVSSCVCYPFVFLWNVLKTSRKYLPSFSFTQIKPVFFFTYTSLILWERFKFPVWLHYAKVADYCWFQIAHLVSSGGQGPHTHVYTHKPPTHPPCISVCSCPITIHTDRHSSGAEKHGLLILSEYFLSSLAHAEGTAEMVLCQVRQISEFMYRH